MKRELITLTKLEQHLTTVRNSYIQIDNGYHLSDSDYDQLLDAVIAIQDYQINIAKPYMAKQRGVK